MADSDMDILIKDIKSVATRIRARAQAAVALTKFYIKKWRDEQSSSKQD